MTDCLYQAVRALLVECNKQKKEYKLVAIESVASVLDSNDLNMFPEFSRLCFPLIDPVCFCHFDVLYWCSIVYALYVMDRIIKTI